MNLDHRNKMVTFPHVVLPDKGAKSEKANLSFHEIYNKPGLRATKPGMINFIIQIITRDL